VQLVEHLGELLGDLADAGSQLRQFGGHPVLGETQPERQ
jgi:hypothetical protein